MSMLSEIKVSYEKDVCCLLFVQLKSIVYDYLSYHDTKMSITSSCFVTYLIQGYTIGYTLVASTCVATDKQFLEGLCKLD